MNVETIFSSLGTLISLFFFFSPIPTFIKAFKTRKIESIPADFFFTNFLNAFAWVCYGIKINIWQILIPNTINIILQVFYLCVFFSIYRERFKRAMVYIAIFVAISVFFYFSSHFWIGMFAMILNTLSYISLVEQITPTLRTREAKYMNILVISLSVINAICWVTFALLINNVYIVVPNAIGLISGIVQIYIFFWAKQWIKESDRVIPLLKRIFRVS